MMRLKNICLEICADARVYGTASCDSEILKDEEGGEVDEVCKCTNMKKDAMALVTGKPVYTDDIAPKDCLVCKILRSPHAHAVIEEINTDIAMKVPGIECILTYEDVPDKRFTMAGQTYPEPSPYDRLILDRRVRFVGDAVAIVAGKTEEAVEKALKLIKVKYESAGGCT